MFNAALGLNVEQAASELYCRIAQGLTASERSFLQSQRDALGDVDSLQTLDRRLSPLWRLGEHRLPSEALIGRLGPVPTDAWSAETAAQVLFVLRLSSTAPALIECASEAALELERVPLALLRALPLLDNPLPCLGFALAASRSEQPNVCKAIALDNPFPAASFSQADYNALIMRTVRLELPLSRVIGLGKRMNRELAQLCLDYLSEARAAGQTPTPDLFRLIAPYAASEALLEMLTSACHPHKGQRLGAVQALCQVAHPGVRPFLSERLRAESDSEVRSAILRGIARYTPMRAANAWRAR